MSTDTSASSPQGGNSTPPHGGYPPPPRSGYPPLSALRRSRTDRKLAGVAGGLGRYAGVDPLIFRILFVVLAVFGGSGLLLYALAWLLVPDDEESESEGQKLINGHTSTSTVATVVAGVVVLILGLVLIGSFIDTGPGLGGLGVLVIVAVIVLLLLRGGHRPPAPQDPAGAPPSEPGAYGQTPGTAYTTAAPPPAYAPTGQTGGATPTSPAYGPTGQTGSTEPAGPGSGPGAPGSTAYLPAAPPAYGQTGHPSGPPAPRLTVYPTRPSYGPPAPPPPPIPPKERSILGRLTLCVALIVVGLLIGWNAATDSDAPVRVVVAAALGVVGLGLVVGAFAGRARGLVVWGILLTLVAGAAAATGIPARGGVGERTWTPASVDHVHPTYRLAIGQSTLDLSQVDFTGSDGVRVQVRQGIGDMEVIIPDDVVVRVDGDVRAGELRVPGRTANGTDVSKRWILPQGSPRDSAVLVIDAELGFGSMEVRRATP